MILCFGNQAMDPQSPTGICSNAALQEQICFFDTMERQIWLGNTLLLVSATMAVVSGRHPECGKPRNFIA